MNHDRKTPQTEAIIRMSGANVHLARGVARAATIGLDHFARNLDHGNVFATELSKNGFIKGAVAGWIAAIQESSKLFEEALIIWRGESWPGANPQPRRKALKRKASK